MKKLLFLALSIGLVCQSAIAQQPFTGFIPDPNSTGDANATYITLSNSSILTSERVLSPTARFQVTDNGANGTYVLELATVALGYGGTGGTTAQAGTNNLLDGCAGASAASGDMLYRAATNWTRLAKGADGQYLSLSSGTPTWATPPSGAPTSASYLTLGLDAGLTAERVATAGSGISLTDAGANSTLTVAVDSTVIRTTGAQSMSGPKTLSGGPIIAAAQTNGLVMAGSSFNNTIKITDPAAARVTTVLDAGADSNFVLSEGTATINGAKTFADLRTSASSIKVNGNDMTFPGSAQTIVGRTVTETLSNKTLDAPTIQNNSTAMVFAQSSGNINVAVSNPAATRTLTIPDNGTNGQFVLTDATQTLNNKSISVGQLTGTLGIGAGGTGQTGATAAFDALAPSSPAKGYLIGYNGTTSHWVNVTNAGGGDDGKVLTLDSSLATGLKWATGGSGAPTGASYVTLGTDGTLTSERVLTAGTGISVTDAGAGSTVTVAVSTVPVANGGTNTTSYTKGDLLVASAGTTLTKLAVGADGGTFLKADSSQTTGTKWSILKGIDMLYGDEADGAITISGATTYSGPIKKNATTFTVNSSQTLTCDTASPVIINCTGAATITGTITATGGGGAGGNSADNKLAGVQGGGPGGGGSGSAATGTGGGGGGGCGGRGGRGYIGGTAQGIPGGGSYANWLGGGSGGGSGNGDSSSNSGSTGGAGGICLMIIAKGAITMSSGTITLDGAAGSAAQAAGGGGGSGGILWTISDTSVSNASGTINTRGGNGGNGTGSTGGGSGGGGRWYRWSPSNTTSGTYTTTAGTAGTSAEAGESGAGTSIGGNPTLPLLTWFCDEEGSQYLTCMETLNRAKRSIHEGLDWNLALEQELNQRTAAAQAAHGDLQKYAVCAHPGFKDTAPLCKEGEVWKNAA